MLRRIIGIACVLALGVGIAWAGDAATKEAAAAKEAAVTAKTAPAATHAGGMDMKTMKAEMLKCSVCKNMATHIEELGPVMRMDVAKLNDGTAIIHSVTDEKKVATFQADCDATNKAGEACVTMTDEQAKTQLCGFCQEIRSIMKAGGHMSNGKTKMGSVMVLTSADAAVQTKISALATQCEMMASMMNAGAGKAYEAATR